VAADPRASAACGLAGPTQRGLLAAGLVSLVVVVVGEKLPARTRQGRLLSLQTSEENPSPGEAEEFGENSDTSIRILFCLHTQHQQGRHAHEAKRWIFVGHACSISRDIAAV
jgi:hypothetical protein